ncbi:long-chain-acyl-CoA synthetase [Lichenibacterium dinghuense]|uniref:long-chain-acyl-CoA synthetase n=1 Tax=Lichenibacterium dinghuense TaxID=2895977 RepID=UPI001F273C97|nr:long-chain-acyl-CoA synthetase [Lichenibacterium sp. 6Y81]
MPPAPAARPSATKRWLRALELTARLDGDEAQTFPASIDALALRHGDRPALLSDGECLSYADLAAHSNRYSRWALSLGLAPGAAVAILMPNCPDYLAAWIGITRAGLSAALLNTSLVGASLAHCIAVAEPAHAVVAASLWEAFAGALPHLDAPPRASLRGGADFDGALAALSGAPLRPDERPAVRPADRALLIYTSGTTGLPKAAVVSHRRIMTWSLWFAGLADLGPDDRMYDCLPLFHSVGGVVAPGCVLAAGGSVVIAERFSVSRFWDEVARWDCTLFQYIGELCRYLLAASPEGAPVPAHRLRLCLGNGLRPDVWEAFRARFAVPEIMEFYAATEGSFSLVNVEGKLGSIGRVPPFLAHRFPAAILRFDVESGAPLRGADGLCVRAAPDEAGEAVGLIGGAEGAGRFEGYTSAADSEAKVLRDVFAPGDRWFRTGDLMRRDAAGFFFFVDRVGDTFRWQGENVATSEVAEALTGAPGVVEATVYGVEVPHRDGRAGMAALVVGEGFSLGALREHAASRLPPYARPAFLRLQAAIDSTDTFKHRKAPLVRDGFDPAQTADPLYADDREAGAYRPLDAALHARIAAGAFRV